MKIKFRLCFLSCVFWGLVSCGRVSTVQEYSQQNDFRLTDATPTSSEANVTITTDGTATWDPPYIPTAAQANDYGSLTFTFGIKISIPLGSSFDYNAKKWAIVFTNASGTRVVYPSTKFTVTNDGNLQTGSTRTGKVKIVLTFADRIFPKEIYDTISAVDGRRTLSITPYYTDAEGSDKIETSGIKKLDAILLKEDIGVIKLPPILQPISATDGAIWAVWSPPTSLTAVKVENNTLKDVDGKSTIVSYLLVYWKVNDCRDSGWSFKANPVLVGNEASVSSKCTYDAQENSDICRLNCSEEALSSILGESLETIAIPVNIPDNTNGSTVKNGCYSVVRIMDTSDKRYAINNLDNGDEYGVMLYAVDAAGHIGKARSGCRFAKPIKIALPSDANSDGTKRTKEDCFVATAASGDANSLTVHYWRILRDRYLTTIGFSKLYYTHAQNAAHWLNAHPRLKNPLNFILETSGKYLVKFDEFLRDMGRKSINIIRDLTSVLDKIISETAYGEENSSVKSASTEKAEETTKTEKQPIASSQHIDFLVGVSYPSKDKDLYKTYYKTRPTGKITIADSYNVFEYKSLEWNLGLSGYYSWNVGKVPEILSDGSKSNSSVVGTRLIIYSFAFAGTTDIRFRDIIFGVASPRLYLTGGVNRLRDEVSPNVPEASTSGSVTSNKPNQVGYTFYKPYYSVRGALELSIPKLFSFDNTNDTYGYGLTDLGLSFYGEYVQDLSNKGLSISALEMGMGMVYILP